MLSRKIMNLLMSGIKCILITWLIFFSMGNLTWWRSCPFLSVPSVSFFCQCHPLAAQQVFVVVGNRPWKCCRGSLGKGGCARNCCHPYQRLVSCSYLLVSGWYLLVSGCCFETNWRIEGTASAKSASPHWNVHMQGKEKWIENETRSSPNRIPWLYFNFSYLATSVFFSELSAMTVATERASNNKSICKRVIDDIISNFLNNLPMF